MDIQKWLDQLDSTTSLFVSAFAGLSETDLNWKPNAETWSVAQNMHHIIVINETYYPLIASVRNGTYQKPWVGKINMLVNFFGKTVLKYVAPDRKKRSKTFPSWEPSSSLISGDILAKLQVHQAELKNWIISCSDLIERNVVISSPANQNIVYTMPAALDIIVTHEMRHYHQALEVNEMRKKAQGA